MKPDISEFSYGYALTEELVRGIGGLRGAPTFPSLLSEGRPGGGYDVSLPLQHLVLFLQFKLADMMVRNTAREVSECGLATPFYRMHLRPGRHSDQHQLLLELENRGQHVFYVAPRFRGPGELNSAYLAQEVVARSVFVRPSSIGPLDDDWHHVAFPATGRQAWLLSEPRRLDRGIVPGEAFLAEVKNALRDQGPDAVSIALAAVESAIRSFEGPATELGQASQLTRARFSDGERLSFLSRTFLDCQALLVGVS